MTAVLDKWKEIVSATTVWQTATATASAAAAAAYIVARGEETAAFPRMTCWKQSTTITNIGDLTTRSASGEIGFNIFIAYNGSLGSDWDAKRLELEEFAEDLGNAIMDLAGTSTYLILREFTVGAIIEPNENEKTNPFAVIECTAAWGVQA